MNKKTTVILLLLVYACSILSACSSKYSEKDISDKLIRFHVVANSDSPEDQALKLEVRDRVLEDIGPKLRAYESKKDSEEFLSKNINYIKETAQKQVYEGGKNYSVSVVLGRSWFPAKVYSDIALPAGEYDALKIIIGSGEGKNWWCVMFPPLCFIDITHGITDDVTEEELRKVLNEEEYNSILTNAEKSGLYEAVKKPVISGEKSEAFESNNNENNMVIKFKSVELAQSLWNDLKKLLDSRKK